MESLKREGRRMDDAWKKAISEGMRRGSATVNVIKNSSLADALSKDAKVVRAAFGLGAKIHLQSKARDRSPIGVSEASKRKSVVTHRSTSTKIKAEVGDIASAAREDFQKAKVAIKKNLATAKDKIERKVSDAIGQYKAKGDSSAIKASEGAKRKSVAANRSTADKLRAFSGEKASKARAFFK